MAFTFFFRDEQTLESAIQEVLPSLQGRAFIHVWDAGCAHGPEPYTLTILLRQRMSDYVFRNVRIHATDLDPSFTRQVATGIFTEQEVKRVPGEIFRKYFRPASSPGFVEVVPELRAAITFSQHDLLSLQPIREGFSLVVCKNVLLHFNESQRVSVLRMFHKTLQPGGILVMEQTQKMPSGLSPFFEQASPCAPIYRKVDRALAEDRPEEGVRAPHALRHAEICDATPVSASYFPATV